MKSETKVEPHYFICKFFFNFFYLTQKIIDKIGNSQSILNQ
jgi:hypothetical protein